MSLESIVVVLGNLIGFGILGAIWYLAEVAVIPSPKEDTDVVVGIDLGGIYLGGIDRAIQSLGQCCQEAIHLSNPGCIEPLPLGSKIAA